MVIIYRKHIKNMGDNTDTKTTPTDSTTNGVDTPPETSVATDSAATPAPEETTAVDTTPLETPAVEPTVTATEAVAETTPSTTETDVTAVATTPEAASTRTRVIVQYGIATAIILVMGVGLLYALEKQGRVNTGVFDSVTELITPAPAAAVVNGVKIPLAQYEKNREQLIQTATFQGLDPENESIKTQITAQALDVLVNTELLRQAAVAAGITVTAADVDARYEEIIATLGGEEQLNTKMAELAITPESLRSDIEGEILIKQHLDKAVDLTNIKIEDAEIQAVYDQANTPGADLPPLAEVRAQIEAQLKMTKEQEIIGAYIETLKKEAQIDTKI
jgi:hypothetical protein